MLFMTAEQPHRDLTSQWRVDFIVSCGGDPELGCSAWNGMVD